jgi:acetyl esterase/lipase
MKLRAVVLNVNYRLAPEHPFPIPIHDSWDALRWVGLDIQKVSLVRWYLNQAARNAASLKATPETGFIVGGESAGGNISAVLAHLAIDDKLNPPLTGQFLSAATFFGHQNVPEKYKAQYFSYEQCQKSQILTGSVHEMFMCKHLFSIFQNIVSAPWSMPVDWPLPKLANYNADYNSPLRSPFYHPGGHAGQPPAYFQACGADMARDEALIYERALREEYGVKTKMDIYPGLPHIFWNYFADLSATKKHYQDTIAGFKWLLSEGSKLW